MKSDVCVDSREEEDEKESELGSYECSQKGVVAGKDVAVAVLGGDVGGEEMAHWRRQMS